MPDTGILVVSRTSKAQSIHPAFSPACYSSAQNTLFQLLNTEAHSFLLDAALLWLQPFVIHLSKAACLPVSIP
jgi:hypothetical protein